MGERYISTAAYHHPVSRLVFVGDIQGCRAELEGLLQAVRFEAGRDELQPVGDLVNRGPDSAGSLRLLRDLGAGGVLGNHDVHLLKVAAGKERLKPSDTFQDVLSAPDRQELLQWLRQRPLIRSFPSALLVHAGLSPAWKDPQEKLRGRDPLSEDAEVDFALRVRHCDAHGRRPRRDDPPPGPPFAPWFEHWKDRDPRTVVFGHWARRGLVHRPGFRGLDTGCVWGGALTAWIAQEDRLVSVSARRAWASVTG